eukprot:3720246-Rhodomonas_salina.1
MRTQFPEAGEALTCLGGVPCPSGSRGTPPFFPDPPPPPPPPPPLSSLSTCLCRSPRPPRGVNASSCSGRAGGKC